MPQTKPLSYLFLIVGPLLLAGCPGSHWMDTNPSGAMPVVEDSIQIPNTATPAGTFQPNSDPVGEDKLNAACPDSRTFDSRLKPGQKFSTTTVYPATISSNYTLGIKETRVIKSVTGSRIELHSTTQYSGLPGTTEEDQICVLKAISDSGYLYTICRAVNAAPETPSTSTGTSAPSKTEYCRADYPSLSNDKKQTMGIYKFANGQTVKARQTIEKVVSAYVCSIGDGPSVVRGQVEENSIVIESFGVLEIDRASCNLTKIFSYSQTKDQSGKVTNGSRSEVLEAPLADSNGALAQSK